MNKSQAKKAFVNAKTKHETGFDYVVSCMNIITPFGKKALTEKEPFLPGEEDLLRQEYQKLNLVRKFVEKNPQSAGELLRIFMEVKDIHFTIERSFKDTLSVVELFETKSLLLKMNKISKILNVKSNIPQDYLLNDVKPLIIKLDPRNDRLDTFYLYDEFSEALGEARKSRREIEANIRQEQKNLKDAIKEQYGIELTQKFEYTASKTNEAQIKKLKEIPELMQTFEDYISMTFSIKSTEKMDGFQKELSLANQLIENEELAVREELSRAIGLCAKDMLENCIKIGELDIAMAKVIYAQNHNCTIPKIADEHIVEFESGRYIPVEDVLISKDKTYCPIDVSLAGGVTCITGANMGGKTVSLKLVGLVMMLAQNAFFVPCKEAVVGLSNYIQILIGDNQSLERGLSSFGSEMEELKEILDNAKDKSLILIDEIASGTNPKEGFALTKSIVEYLTDKPYITLLTTHFDGVFEHEDIKKLQVVGLAGVDFDKLNETLIKADQSMRVNIISEHMDYRLRVVKNDAEIPQDAINIAKMLGINEEIIESALSYARG